MVKKTHVNKKLCLATKGVGGRNMRRGVTTLDKYHNMIAMRCLVKPTEKGPFKDCLGEIRAIHKDQLFLWFT